jgi:hypothetical protein
MLGGFAVAYLCAIPFFHYVSPVRHTRPAKTLSGIGQLVLWPIGFLFYVPVVLRVMDASRLPATLQEAIRLVQQSWLAWPIIFLAYLMISALAVIGIVAALRNLILGN